MQRGFLCRGELGLHEAALFGRGLSLGMSEERPRRPGPELAAYPQGAGPAPDRDACRSGLHPARRQSLRVRWKPAETRAPVVASRHTTEAVTIVDHIAAARALGPAEPAIDRFLEIINRRRHLPVRIMDEAIRVLHLIQIVRLEMNDLQFYTLSRRGTPRVNCGQGVHQ